MARRKENRISVYRPRRNRSGWRVDIRDGHTGRQSSRCFGSEEEAEKEYRNALQRTKDYNTPTLEEMIIMYRDYQLRKGNKLQSTVTFEYRMASFFGTFALRGCDITPRLIQKRYEKRQEGRAAATHRNELSQVKTFLSWAVEEGFLRSNPVAKVKPVGRINRGKPQLRAHEAKAFLDRALELADSGDTGGFACAAVLVLGLRSSEILKRRVRDVDPLMQVLHIENAKTWAGNRVIEIPDLLWPYFAELIEGRQPNEVLLPSWTHDGYRRRSWLRARTKRICEELGLPKICPHGLRGTHASLAQAAGVSAHVVAQTLGHEDVRTTNDHYTAAGVRERSVRTRTLKVLTGGKGSRDEKTCAKE